ncbi:MAG TPA: efflux RND transporter periplasmic adaptor subunit, partial [Thermomicrobiales bacterium]|nr:efflux RND transporter periplasmic adaptor subunit [Thermomicrobiales bacterium]
MAQVRLRFLAVLVGAFLIVGKWDSLRNYWQTLTISLDQEPLGGAVSPETEYFCPMCPGVLAEWPSRCSVCNMPLVRRRKGEAIQLPDGVLSRMQLSPYRVQLAGIRTAAVGYRPLVREAVVSGAVIELADDRPLGDSGEGANMSAPVSIDADIGELDLPLAAPGAAVQATSDAYPGHDPWPGVVLAIERRVSPRTRRVRVRVIADDPQRELLPGMSV